MQLSDTTPLVVGFGRGLVDAFHGDVATNRF